MQALLDKSTVKASVKPGQLSNVIGPLRGISEPAKVCYVQCTVDIVHTQYMYTDAHTCTSEARLMSVCFTIFLDRLVNVQSMFFKLLGEL